MCNANLKMFPFTCTGREFHMLLGVRNYARKHMDDSISDLQRKEIQNGYYIPGEDLNQVSKHHIKCTHEGYDFLRAILQVYRRGDAWMTCNEVLQEIKKAEDLASGAYLRPLKTV